MAKAATGLRETIAAVCRMHGDNVLPSEYMKEYKGEQPNESDTEEAKVLKRISAAQWFLFKEANRAADCIKSKALKHITSPQGFLAELFDVDQVPVRRVTHTDIFEMDWDDAGQEMMLDIATSRALAAANILLLQLRELIQLYGQELWEYLQDPLKTLIKCEMGNLEEFSRGKEVDLARFGLTVVEGSERNTGYPAPVTEFPALARLSAMMNACLKTNQHVESKWSLLTMRHNSGVRHTGPEFLSASLRQKDFKTSGMLAELSNPEFQDNLAEARHFRNVNRPGIRNIYRIKHEESQALHNSKNSPKEFYENTNIVGDKQKKGSKKGVDKKKASKRTSGAIMSRYHEGSEPDSDAQSEGSESADSPESDLDCDDSSVSFHEGSSPEDDGDAGDDDALDSEDGVPWAAHARRGHMPERRGLQPSEDSPEVCNESTDAIMHYPLQDTPKVCEPLQTGGNDPRQLEDPQDGPCKGAMDDSDSYASDVPSNFFDSDEDLDIPLIQRKFPAGSRDCSDPVESVSSTRHLLSHPFPDPKDVSDEQAAQHPWKLDSIRHLIQTLDWESTKVECQLKQDKIRGNSAILTRLDGKQFPLKPSKERLLYVLNNDDGLELINVEALQFKVPDSEETHRTKRKKVCVKYTRVLSTENAVSKCKSDKDFTQVSHNGLTRMTSLGASSLKKLMKRQKECNDSRLIFHRGDFPFETSAENIVGFVPWESSCDGVAGVNIPDYSRKMLARINTALSLAIDKSQIQLKLSSLGEIDIVYLGPDFSEHDGE
jgi:hypothetical protein